MQATAGTETETDDRRNAHGRADELRRAADCLEQAVSIAPGLERKGIFTRDPAHNRPQTDQVGRSPTPDRTETLPTLVAGVIGRLRELSADLLDMIDRRWNEDTRIDGRIQRSESPWEYATSWNAG